jgi:hypothetical protein
VAVALFVLVGVTALLASCARSGTQSGGQTLEKVTCPTGVAATSAPAGAASGGEPDFALYGFPRVAATERFTPGREQRVSAGSITVTLPGDFYTDPLQFELLVGDEQVWQGCVPDTQVVIAPYAYRVSDPAAGNRVGRFDKPVTAVISDPRIGAGTTYWTTAPANPPTGQPASAQPQVEGNAIRVNNGSARIGWFATVPRR